MTSKLILSILLFTGTASLSACQPVTTSPSAANTSTPTPAPPAITSGAAISNPGRYQPYTSEAFQSQASSQRLLFFHAPWCPTCKSADTELTQNGTQLPPGVVVFKTDYDSETELKQKYHITYQHTFVLVDNQGNQITQWNGGGLSEIIARTSAPL